MTHTYSVSIYPLMQACVSYLSAMILLFLEPQFLEPKGRGVGKDFGSLLLFNPLWEDVND
jgi:hypothetical protein